MMRRRRSERLWQEHRARWAAMRKRGEHRPGWWGHANRKEWESSLRYNGPWEWPKG